MMDMDASVKVFSDIEQNTPEWQALRCGRFTASRAKMLMAKTKSGPAASRGNLISQLAVERLTGAVDEGYTNAAMQRGHDLEDDARQAYEAKMSFENNARVEQVAFMVHGELDFMGCSPDGLVYCNDAPPGMLEIKCPSAMAKHMSYLLEGKHAIEYRWQIQHQLLVSDRTWCDIVSYDPRYPEGAQLVIKRVERNDDDQAALKAAAIAANDEVNVLVNRINEKRNEQFHPAPVVDMGSNL